MRGPTRSTCQRITAGSTSRPNTSHMKPQPSGQPTKCFGHTKQRSKLRTAFSVKDANGRPTNEAVISHTDNLGVGVVCAYQNGIWEPLWMIKQGADGLFHKHELPSC